MISPASLVLVLASSSQFMATPPASEPEVRYGRDIRPILSDRCFLCHGPDRAMRKADLRLDSFEEATRDLDGVAAIVPGDPDASLLVELISHHDPDERMPPEESGKRSLAPEQVEMIRRWIESGAEYEEHWAFKAPESPDVPVVSGDDWSRNDIDRFIYAELEARGVRRARQLDRGREHAHAHGGAPAARLVRGESEGEG